MNDARDNEVLSALAVVDIVVVSGEAAHTKRKLVSKTSSLGIVGNRGNTSVMEATTMLAISMLTDLLAISYQMSSRSRSAKLETRISFISFRF